MSKRNKFTRKLLRLMRRSKLDPEEVALLLMNEVMTMNIILSDHHPGAAYKRSLEDLNYLASVHGLNILDAEQTVH